MTDRGSRTYEVTLKFSAINSATDVYAGIAAALKHGWEWRTSTDMDDPDAAWFDDVRNLAVGDGVANGPVYVRRVA